jgi:hypothetical protein
MARPTRFNGLPSIPIGGNRITTVRNTTECGTGTAAGSRRVSLAKHRAVLRSNGRIADSIAAVIDPADEHWAWLIANFPDKPDSPGESDKIPAIVAKVTP